MRFSIRDMAISTALLSFYLAVLTRLWRALLDSGQVAAAFAAGVVMIIVLLQFISDEAGYRLRRHGKPLLRIYRPQQWRWHYAIGGPVLLLGTAAIVSDNAGFQMMSLYLVLSAFSVHLFVCVTPLVSFTINGPIINHALTRWGAKRYTVTEKGNASYFTVGHALSIPLPADRVEEVQAILDEHQPFKHSSEVSMEEACESAKDPAEVND